ncbi:hypothetical protein DPMN_027683 [Dreissena polymorpha]|uniref:Uncharacterized protein n=1 Tax=Dreissena polymorpha TaxID=45954 RepID=A0A9D4RFR5_DREPO|nr:hypothetical protein DPMN_027683 [Dreissena polymorpha]
MENHLNVLPIYLLHASTAYFCHKIILKLNLKFYSSKNISLYFWLFAYLCKIQRKYHCIFLIFAIIDCSFSFLCVLQDLFQEILGFLEKDHLLLLFFTTVDVAAVTAAVAAITAAVAVITAAVVVIAADAVTAAAVTAADAVTAAAVTAAAVSAASVSAAAVVTSAAAVDTAIDDVTAAVISAVSVCKISFKNYSKFSTLKFTQPWL